MLPKPTVLTRKYLGAVTFRLLVFLMVLLLYCLDRPALDFTAAPLPSLPLWVLWLAVLFSMAAQLNPKSGLTARVHEAVPQPLRPRPRLLPQALEEAVPGAGPGGPEGGRQLGGGQPGLRPAVSAGDPTDGGTHPAVRPVLPVRSGVRAVLLPFSDLFDEEPLLRQLPHLRLGLLDDGRPLAFAVHWFSWSLLGMGLVVLLVWEVRYRRHPERFWAGSNKLLQCAHCREQLCRYKYPRSPRFR